MQGIRGDHGAIGMGDGPGSLRALVKLDPKEKKVIRVLQQ